MQCQKQDLKNKSSKMLFMLINELELLGSYARCWIMCA